MGGKFCSAKESRAADLSLSGSRRSLVRDASFVDARVVSGCMLLGVFLFAALDVLINRDALFGSTLGVSLELLR